MHGVKISLLTGSTKERQKATLQSWLTVNNSVPIWGEHCVNGSPTNPGKQTQLGVWLTTLHSALTPQTPGQGSVHFKFMHAKWLLHSLLLTHSGLQFGGAPKKSGKQEHDGDSPTTLHCAFGPHGEGWQGFVGMVTTGSSERDRYKCNSVEMFVFLAYVLIDIFGKDLLRILADSYR